MASSTDDPKHDEPSSKIGADPESNSEGKNTSGGGPLGINFPPDIGVWHEARRLVSDKNTRVESLAVCCAQDPVIVVELLKTANAMFFSGGRSQQTSTKAAIVRLGSDVVLETLEKMKDRPLIEDQQVLFWLDVHRNRCKRAAIVSKILAEAVSRTLSDDCEVAGLFYSIGDMLAVMHLKEKYVKLATENSRGTLNYKLIQSFKFDVEKMGLNYLRRHGIPEAILFALDREARAKTPDRAIMKPICMSAGEMIEAFDSNRWEKLAPGKQIPPKSAIRMLQITDNQYLKIYERATEYLTSAKKLEERRQERVKNSPKVTLTYDSQVGTGAQQDLQTEIQSIIKATDLQLTYPAPESEQEPDDQDLDESEYEDQDESPSETEIKTVPTNLKVNAAQFGLDPTKNKEKTVARVQKSDAPAVVEPPKMRTQSANKVVNNLSNMLESASTSEQLLSDLLAMLVDQGPFEKSALIVVSQDRKHAIVVAARGPNIGNGQKLLLDDPLSPLAKCFSKIQSFGNKENKSSPFGSKAFALAPIDADHETPVALYADCGVDGSLTFEARRIFRNVVEILNQKLPSLPGGIPIEVGLV